MIRTRRQRFTRGSEIWPGFVDVLSTLLLVIIFLLVVFMLAQFFLQKALSGRDNALAQLTQQVAELTEMLSLERQANADLRLSIAQLSSELQGSTTERDELLLTAESLRRDIDALKRLRAELEVQVSQMAAVLKESEGELASLREEFTIVRDRASELEAELSTEQERTALAQRELEEREIRLSETATALEEEHSLSADQRDQIVLLNSQIAELRKQLARIEKALEIAETEAEEQNIVIADLGKRLNLALAGKVEELARYRSEFFGRLREILSGRQDIRIVGDRFVFQSDVLFESASAELSPEAMVQLAEIGHALLEIAGQIPPEISWILEVDGHTDRRPISTAAYPSNWELSLARAMSVVRFLVEIGVPPESLSAAGFGQFQPIDASDDEIAS
ncbi:MAG: peptidoglycan-binding protein, partial [Alphaproteobacteria bacterium]